MAKFDIKFIKDLQVIQLALNFYILYFFSAVHDSYHMPTYSM